MSDSSALPVAPEFVDILNDSAIETAVACLRQIDAPPSLIHLVGNIYELGYYLESCYRHPETLQKERADRFDIETIVIETVNAIAECGGTFQNGNSVSIPRKIFKPVKVKAAK